MTDGGSQTPFEQSTIFSPDSFKWPVGLTNSKRLASLFNNEILADIHFIVGKTQPVRRIPGHKFVLSLGSDVFYAMFNGPMATQEEEIELSDMEPDSFLCFLRYFYTGYVITRSDTAMWTLYAAKKYDVSIAEQQVVAFLQENISPGSVFSLLTQARFFESEELAAKCLETIDQQPLESFASKSLLDISNELLCDVLQRESLEVIDSKEIAVFHAVLRWSEAECHRRGIEITSANQRMVIGRCLNLIRFPIMSMEQFAQEVVPTNILTTEEVVSLYQYKILYPKPQIDFPTNSRASPEIVVGRFQESSGCITTGYNEVIRFSVDRRIFLTGLGLYGYNGSSFDVLIDVTDCEAVKKDWYEIPIFDLYSVPCSSTVFTVWLNEPIKIQPGKTYEISVHLSGGSHTYYGLSGRQIVESEISGTGKKVTFKFENASGSRNTFVSRGQIPQLMFRVI